MARPPGRPAFDRADADFATVLASVTAAGIAQSERLEEAHRLAFTDPLTGLANRRAVDMRLDEALEAHTRRGAVVSLVVCDLNGLKRVNDSLGHETGDRLLERFGSVLSVCGAMLPGALAARLSGDEFCLLAVGPPADEVVAVADELCRRAGALELGEGVACGVASTGDPIGPVRSARRLFRLADAAQVPREGRPRGPPGGRRSRRRHQGPGGPARRRPGPHRGPSPHPWPGPGQRRLPGQGRPPARRRPGRHARRPRLPGRRQRPRRRSVRWRWRARRRAGGGRGRR